MSDLLINRSGVLFPSEGFNADDPLGEFLGGEVRAETVEAARTEIERLRRANNELSDKLEKCKKVLLAL